MLVFVVQSLKDLQLFCHFPCTAVYRLRSVIKKIFVMMQTMVGGIVKLFSKLASHHGELGGSILRGSPLEDQIVDWVINPILYLHW